MNSFLNLLVSNYDVIEFRIEIAEITGFFFSPELFKYPKVAKES